MDTSQIPRFEPEASSSRSSSFQIPIMTSEEVYTSTDSKHTRPPFMRSLVNSLSRFWYNWKWEAILSFLVLATPFIILATLFPHVGTPLPNWPFHITINAVLAIYAVAFKTCLAIILSSCIGQLQWSWFSNANRPLCDLVRYNDAAQGPWGSLRLLISHNFQQPLAAFGALLLVASIAVEPFVQQITTLSDCSILLETHNATVARTNNFLNRIFTDSNPSLNSTLSTIVYTPNAVLSWNCLTGNCTFSEAYGTVGYCSTCEDRSSDIMFNTECLPNTRRVEDFASTGLEICPKGTHSGLTSSLMADRSSNGNHSWINMTFSEFNSTMCTASSLVINDALDQTRSQVHQSGVVQSVILLGKTDVSGKTNLTTGKPLSNCVTEDENNTWRCRGYGAASCTLRPCVNVYNATIVNGEVKEHLISTSGSLIWGMNATGKLPYSGSAGMVDTHCLSDEEATWLKEKGYNLNMSTRWLSFAGGQNTNLTMSLINHKCLYTLTSDSIAKLVRDHLAGTVAAAFASHSYTNEPSIYDNFAGPPLIQKLFNNGDTDFARVESAFTNLSSIFTAWIRTHGSELGFNDAIGRVFQSSTCLHVQWAWLAFPAALSILTVLLFLLVVLATASEQTPIWKDSPLAWIMRGPSGFGMQSTGAREVSTIEDMNGRAKKIVVNLTRGMDARIVLVEDRNKEAD